MVAYIQKQRTKVRERVTFWIIHRAVARAIAQEERKYKRAAA